MSQKSHKTDVRLYIADDYKMYLKQIAEDKGISVNRLIMELVEKKYPLNKKAMAKLRAEQPTNEVEVVPPAVCKPAPSNTAEQDRKKKERRLVEVNTILKKAYNGDTLPTNEYRRLKQEQTELRAELGHN